MNTTKRLIALLSSTMLGIFLAVSLATTHTAAGEPAPQPDTPQTIKLLSSQNDEENICLNQNSVNFLRNPSFEGQYKTYVPTEPISDCPAGVCTTAQIPDEWTPYWRSHNPADPEFIIRQPEYKPACINNATCPFPNRLRHGSEALQYFTFFSTHEGGVRQTVPVSAGLTYCLSTWGHSWSAQDSGDIVSGPEDGELFQKIGIDPTGGTDWMSADIIWSDQRMQYDVYGLFTVTAKAETDQMTVFLYSQPSFAVKHNDVYWDDAFLAQMTGVYTTSITTTENILAFTDISNTLQVSQSVNFSLTGTGPLEGYTWTAQISPTAGMTGTMMLTPTFNQSSGGITDTLIISVDTAGLTAGVYTADVIITTEPETGNTPIHIPVKAIIAEELKRVYLPANKLP